MKLDQLFAGISLAEDVIFSAPWEARAFAMAVRMSESGLFTWDEFRAHLIEEIGKAERVRAHGWVEPGDGYYTYFLRALEKLLLEKGLVDSAGLEATMREIGSADHDDHEH